MRIAIKFAYDGRNYHGYARQPSLITVEGEIISTLIKNRYIKDIKEANIRSASRTDKGVSALCNVIVFNTKKHIKYILQKISNDCKDIIFYGIKKLDFDFNPRHANLRHYRYYLTKEDHGIEEIISNAAFFTGEHDFSNFARIEDDKNPVREIHNIVLSEDKDFLILDFYAKNFLWQQIRRIVSSLDKVAKGKLKKEQIMNALNQPWDKVDFGLASAEPLFLKNIIYNFDFRQDQKLLRKAKIMEKKIISSF